MRIGFDATPAATQRAGVGRYSRELLHALLEMPGNDEFALFCAANREASDQFAACLPPGAARDVRRVPVPERYVTIAWQRLRFPLTIERILGEIDVFHGPDFVVPPSRRPRVVTIHDLSFLVAPQYSEPGLVAYLRASVPRSLQRAVRIIAVSNSVAAEIAEAYPWARERVVAIPNGVRVPRDFARVDGHRPIVLMVGTIEPRKNIPTLLRAMAFVREAHADATLMVAGRIGWRSRDIMEQLREAERVGVARFVEAPDDALLDRLYARASVVACPSHYEGFGLPILEAMARRVPVVAGDIPALRETGGDAALYADPRDPEALATLILDVISNRTLASELSSRGTVQATRHSWGETARRTRRVYAAAEEVR